MEIKAEPETEFIYKKKRNYIKKNQLKENKDIKDELEDVENVEDEEDKEDKEEKRDNKLLKQKYGKFYTENYNYIFQSFQLPDYHNIRFVEPFVGKGHLLHFLTEYYKVPLENLNIEFYDIENHIQNTNVRDSIQNPPDYDDKFVITNPPFLALNKSKEKDTFHMYGTNDLYKCFLKTIIHRNCMGGLLIIPINFWSSIRKNDILLRKMFLEKYRVIRMNLFEEKVFPDTSFMVTSFLFERRNENDDNFIIPTYIYPSKRYLEFTINEDTYWMIGGELYNLPLHDDTIVMRVYERDIDNDNNKKEIITRPNTRIFLHGLDDGKEKRISLEYLEGSKDLYIGKETDRSYASLYIYPEMNEMEQRRIVERFNRYIEKMRERYHSMFLTNYRESKEWARKRISFQLTYDIINYLINHPDLEI